MAYWDGWGTPRDAPVEEGLMTAGFNPLNLPTHIHVDRSGRERDGTPMATMVCGVCGAEEETPDTPAAMRALAGRFVRSHMDCTPVGVDQE